MFNKSHWLSPLLGVLLLLLGGCDRRGPVDPPAEHTSPVSQASKKTPTAQHKRAPKITAPKAATLKTTPATLSPKTTAHKTTPPPASASPIVGIATPTRRTADTRSASRRAPPRAQRPPTQNTRRAAKNRGPPIDHFDNIEVRNYNRRVFRGTVNLRPTIDRILKGERHRHRNDGGVFGNRERRLPRKARGYYREYVHPTLGIRGVGPQRIIVGRGGDWYYTPDHYRSFRPMQ